MTISTPTPAPVPTLTNKSQLAKLLAREDITVQYSKSVSTALFNSVTRTLTLPVWIDMSNELHEMLVAHEIGHALHTPASEKDLLDAMKAFPQVLCQGISGTAGARLLRSRQHPDAGSDALRPNQPAGQDRFPD